MNDNLRSELLKVNPFTLLEFALENLGWVLCRSSDGWWVSLTPTGFELRRGDVDGAPDAKIKYAEGVAAELKIYDEDWQDCIRFEDYKKERLDKSNEIVD